MPESRSRWSSTAHTLRLLLRVGAGHGGAQVLAVHRQPCPLGGGVAETKAAIQCATCDGETWEAWRGADGGWHGEQ